MQNQKSKITYWVNGEKVTEQESVNLTGEYFKYFEGSDVKAVDYSSVESLFDGDYKSKRQINDHLQSVLGGYKKPNVKINSTRHKAREEGKFHQYPLAPEECFLKDDVITSSNRGEKETVDYINKIYSDLNTITKNPLELDTHSLPFFPKRGKMIKYESKKEGVKESQSVSKAPIFTYCKVNSLALEALAFRALYGHEKYKETDQDWQNFTRVPNAEQEYGEALFRHALNIGEDETEEQHLIASAWNAVARLEIFLRNKKKNLHNSK